MGYISYNFGDDLDELRATVWELSYEIKELKDKMRSLENYIEYLEDDICNTNNVQGMRFNLKAYRRKHNLTQTDLAEKLGTTQSAVSQLERNWDAVRPSTIRQIATTLNVNQAELFTKEYVLYGGGAL